MSGRFRRFCLSCSAECWISSDDVIRINKQTKTAASTFMFVLYADETIFLMNNFQAVSLLTDHVENNKFGGRGHHWIPKNRCKLFEHISLIYL